MTGAPAGGDIGHAGAGSASRSFFARFLLALLFVNITTIAALSYIAYSHSIASLTKSARESIAQQVDILADKFDQEYRRETERSVRDLVDSPILDDYLLGSDAERLVITRRLEKAYKRLMEVSPSLAALMFADADGDVIVEVRDARRLRDHGNLHGALDEPVPPELSALRRTAPQLFEDMESTPLLLRSGNMEWFMPQIEPLVAGPLRVVGDDVRAIVALPILDVDTAMFGGAVFVEQRFDRLFDELRGLEFFQLNPVWVLSPDGEVLSGPAPDAVGLDPRASLPSTFQPRTQLLSVDDGIVGYRDLSLRPGEPFIRLVVSLPQAALRQDLRPAVNFFSGVVVAAVFIISALSFWISRYLARPVKQLERTQNQLAHAQRLARLGHWELDEASARVLLSDQASSILGRSGRETLSFEEFIDHAAADDRPRLREVIEAARVSPDPTSIEHQVATADGEQRFVRQEVGRESFGPGQATRLAGTLQDITERRETERQIQSLAYYDQVTGLANRALLNKLAEEALAGARDAGHAMAVIFLDLDHFKRVNDTVGHDAGDELLRQVGDRLRHTIRPDDTVRLVPAGEEGARSVARLGGDEFIILLSNLARRSDAEAAAMRIRQSLIRPFHIGGKQLYVTGSLGIAVYPDDGNSVDELLRHADAAMYHAKHAGRNRLAFFDEAMDAELNERLNMETRLHQALEHDEFILHFQPRVELRTGAIVSMEALIRWRSADGSIVPPDAFIGVAEDCGLIVPIGNWVVETACREAARWQDDGWPDVGVSINISPVQFATPGLVETVRGALLETGIAPECVELEMTETVLFENVETSVELALALKAEGVRLSVDDFGTGYSSLGVLQQFPVDTLKIDRSFVRDVARNPGDALIVDTAINLGRNLGLRVVAEGVEDEAQLEFLQAANCDEGQGYLFSRPVAVENLPQLLGKHRKRA